MTLGAQLAAPPSVFATGAQGQPAVKDGRGQFLLSLQFLNVQILFTKKEAQITFLFSEKEARAKVLNITRFPRPAH